MSENLHPHDEQWDDLPLPNEEEAWQKMKLLLDKEDKHRRVLPFWFWRYGLLGLLFVGTATGGYFILNQSRKQTSANALIKETGRQQEAEQTAERNKTGKEKEQMQPVPVMQKKAVKTKAESKVGQLPFPDNAVGATKEKKEVSYNTIPVRKPE